MQPHYHRPEPCSGDGILLKSHFQVAYVTNDIARARDVLMKRYGIRDIHDGEGESPNGDGYMRTCRAWAGGTMYELIQAEGPKLNFYNGRLGGTEFQIRHHHLGYLVESEAEWTELLARIDSEELKIAYRITVPGYVRIVYVEAIEMDHYLEFVFPEGAGMEIMTNIPVN